MNIINTLNMENYYEEFHGEVLEGVPMDQILREYFPDYDYKGVFLDVGVFEPIRISNSFHFEKNGWDVFCFEANTDGIPLLRQHRKHVFNYAIYDKDKDNVEFTIVTSNGWTAGFSAIEVSQEIANVFNYKINEIKTIMVPQKTLNTILSQEIPHIHTIDILKIDVEGGELKVLNGIDLLKYKPKVILLENITNNTQIPDYLEKYGYVLDKHTSYNQFFILKE